MIVIARVTKSVQSGYKHVFALREGMIDHTTIYLIDPKSSQDKFS